MNQPPIRNSSIRILRALLSTSCFALLVSGCFGQITRQQVLLNPQRQATLGPTCPVSQLNLVIRTGNDDLRGGSNNLNVEVHFADGTMQTFQNVNQGYQWNNNTTKMVSISLKQPVAPNQIKFFRLIHSAQSGYSATNFNAVGALADPGVAVGMAAGGAKTEDNWNMDQFQAIALGPRGTNIPIASSGLHRFTGTNPSFDISTRSDVNCSIGSLVRMLSFTFHTGSDDLRGGNDNLNIAIHFADGTSQTESNVNHSSNWPNSSTRGTEIILNRPVSADQIRSVTLETTFTGGSGGDNWNMDSVEIDTDQNQTLATSGFHRFSSDWTGPKAKQLTIPIGK